MLRAALLVLSQNTTRLEECSMIHWNSLMLNLYLAREKVKGSTVLPLAQIVVRMWHQMIFFFPLAYVSLLPSPPTHNHSLLGHREAAIHSPFLPTWSPNSSPWQPFPMCASASQHRTNWNCQKYNEWDEVSRTNKWESYIKNSNSLQIKSHAISNTAWEYVDLNPMTAKAFHTGKPGGWKNPILNRCPRPVADAPKRSTVQLCYGSLL